MWHHEPGNAFGQADGPHGATDGELPEPAVEGVHAGNPAERQLWHGAMPEVPSTWTGRRNAASSLRNPRFRSRREPSGLRMPGESTYSSGAIRAIRAATWWLLVLFSANQSRSEEHTSEP